MRSLIEQKVALASLKRTAPKIVEIADAAAVLPPAREKPARVAATMIAPSVKPEIPAAKPEPRAVDTRAVKPQAEEPVPGSTEPIKPLLVKTFSVKAGAAKAVTAMSLLSPEPIAARSALASAATVPATRPEPDHRPEVEALPPAPPGARPGVLGVLPAKEVAQPSPQRTVTASIGAVAPAAPAAISAPAPAAKEAKASPPAMPVAESKPRGGGWVIQVGAFEDRDEAREKLADARSKAGNLLKGAEPYTEIVSRGDKRYYRARFAGLKESLAEQACKELQKSKIACFATRN
jgi:D-alanyl-D-alanine carboxypeptidase